MASPATMSKKRNHPEEAITNPEKRACLEEPADLVVELTSVLAEIKSTPSSGQISAELLETLKGLMLQIEHLSADKSNTKAREMKDESDRCLESWFDDLLAQCEADGELDWNELELELSEDDDDDVEDTLALALALQEDHDNDNDNDDESEIVDIEELSDCIESSSVRVV
ncbi:hypothetical protein J3Q64DRAFT_1767136 [Phycomyces blakesleeanus]|uniref:Uncharacterized protein n=1 Tax=Phycomyces blakesleeanus TaxID=4837 RepID=A0ABR3AP11_PHYBL